MPSCADRRHWVLAAAVLGSTLAFVDESVVNVALPRMESDLHTTLAAMQWVINGYTLCMSAFLLLGGAAADQLGRRRMFMVGIAVFAAASIGCGLAPDVRVLIALRAIQGLGAALLIPCTLALIGAAFDEKERGAAIGIWAGASAIASGAAPLLGGWLVDHSSWRMIFLINPLVAIATLWIAWRRVPESRLDQPPGIDWIGAALAFLALGSLVYGFIASSEMGWNQFQVIGSLSMGAALLIVFVRTEKARAAPMMPLELFRSLRFTGVNLLTLLLYGALGAAFFFLPFLLIQGRGYTAATAGSAYLPFTIVVGFLSRWAGGLVDRFGARWPLVAGPALIALAFVLLESGGGDYSATLLSMTVLGVGVAVTAAPLTTVVVNAVPADRTGVASGINNAIASVGSLMLIAVLGSVALGIFDHSLDRIPDDAGLSSGVKSAVHSARGGFVIPPSPSGLSAEERDQAHALIAASLIATVRTTLRISALLALVSAVTAFFTIRSGVPPPLGRA